MSNRFASAQQNLDLVLAAVNAVRRIPAFASANPSSIGAAVCLLVTPDASGHSPLHHAAASGDKDLLEKILEVLKHVRAPFPTLEARDRYGKTALHWAVERGYSGVIKALLDVGASPNAEDLEGRSPLHWAIGIAGSVSGERLNFYHDMIRFLLQSGADVFATDASGATCVHMAAANGDGDLLGVLVELGGAPVNAIDNAGENALFYAVREGKLDLVSKLVQYGIDSTAVNESQENVVDFCRSLGDEKATARLESIFAQTGQKGFANKEMDLESSSGSLLGSGQEFIGMWSSNPVHLLR